MAICHSLAFCDEHFQVNGCNFLMDYGAVKMKHLSFGGIDNIKKRSLHFQVNVFSLSSKKLKHIKVFGVKTGHVPSGTLNI